MKLIIVLIEDYRSNMTVYFDVPADWRIKEEGTPEKDCLVIGHMYRFTDEIGGKDTLHSYMHGEYPTDSFDQLTAGTTHAGYDYIAYLDSELPCYAYIQLNDEFILEISCYDSGELVYIINSVEYIKTLYAETVHTEPAQGEEYES